MIALNELLDNLEHYRQVYNMLGFKADIDKIKKLECERKQLQLKSESLRAECNKKCSEVALIRMQGKDCDVLLKEIVLLDKHINKLNKKLNSYGKSINKYLRKLRNLPDEVVETNEKALCDGNILTINEFLNAVLSRENYHIHGSTKSSDLTMKEFSGRLFEESRLPNIIICSDGLLCLFTDFDLYDELNAILLLLKTHAKNIVRKKSSETEFSSADEYVALFLDGSVKVELKKEFYTREYSIKYKNSKIDMTKFVNQINIIIKR